MNGSIQRFDCGVPAIVAKPEFAFDADAGSNCEFYTVRLHKITPTAEIGLFVTHASHFHSEYNTQNIPKAKT